MRSVSYLGLSLTAALLLLSGCGGGGAPVAVIQPPSALSYTTMTVEYIQGTAIAPDSPTSSGGAVTSYSVSPTLPGGLNLSTSTGVISGTPTAVASTATYTVMASNSSGNTTASLTITVNVEAPASLSYSPGTAVYTVGTPIPANIPSSTGGPVTSYSVSPALPSGVNLDDTTGIISGYPTAVAAATSFTITASNLTGSAMATLTLTVNAAGAGVQFIPNMNQWITPLALAGSQFVTLDTGLTVNGQDWLAGQAVSTAVSPDGLTLLVLTSGFNRVTNSAGVQDPDDSQEYVFIYDISTGLPVVKQVVTIPNSYSGIAFDPLPRTVAGQVRYNAFYVASGMGDSPYTGSPYTSANYNPVHPGGDNVHVFTLSSDGTTWQEQSELPLGHTAGVGFGVLPCAAGIAVSDDGQTLVVANYYDDSVSVFTGGLGNWTPLSSLTTEKPGELDLRPGKAASSPRPGSPGGEYPFWVAIATTTNTATATTASWAYVSSIRDREIDVVNLNGTPAVAARIPVKGQPNKMTLNKARTRLFVAEDQSDTIDVIDINPNDGVRQNTVLETIDITKSFVPATLVSLTGANTNSVVLSPDETQLYVTNGNLNTVAVVALTGTDQNDHLRGPHPHWLVPKLRESSAPMAGGYTW